MVWEKDGKENSASEQIFCRARILCLDDDKGLGRLLQKRLQRMACAVDVAFDGEEGLRLFAKGSYDVVITDYHMPLVDGLEVLRRLKDSVPVIVLTGEGDAKVAVEAMKLGAADYVTKDINGEYIEFLPSVIDRVLERQQLISDRKQALAELQASEARYKAVIDDQTEVICRFVPGGKLTFGNLAFCRYFGIKPADIIFQNMVKILSRKTYQNMKSVLKALTPEKPVVMGTDCVKMFDGKEHWLQWTGRAIFDSHRKLREYQMVGRDITELKSIEEALRESEEKNSALLSAIPDTILRIDRQGICVDLRTKNEPVLNLSPDSIGKNITAFLPPDVAVLLRGHLGRLYKEGTGQIFQFKIRQGDKVSHQEARLLLAGSDEALVILRDVTERTELEQQLQYLSIHDSLTGLYNRAYFEEEMRRLESSRYDPVGIVICDVDGLKIINDNLGHGRGDQLLKAASSVILQAFRDSDAVARIGGDEFAVLLPNASRPMLEGACRRLRRIVACYNADKPEIYLSISVGAAVRSDETQPLGEVFQQADEAMYGDKLLRSKPVRSAIAQSLREYLERRTIYSKEHSDRVKALMRAFADSLRFGQERYPDLELFSEYHDIGKVALPENILANNGIIDSEQYILIKRHCEVGYRIAMATPELTHIADWILKHHEWWSGSGYPLGIKGSAIPLESRMMAIADAFESMTGGRNFRAPKSQEAALAELRLCSGTQFDPELVEVFSTLISDTADGYLPA
ncbi:MAG: diguanylate cyclase [Negativicutes bacterium]|nr:diguanylate cyclase [Negativicutes bacterium]